MPPDLRAIVHPHGLKTIVPILRMMRIMPLLSSVPSPSAVATDHAEENRNYSTLRARL
jgi:hypothetical protein